MSSETESESYTKTSQGYPETLRSMSPIPGRLYWRGPCVGGILPEDMDGTSSVAALVKYLQSTHWCQLENLADRWSRGAMGPWGCGALGVCQGRDATGAGSWAGPWHGTGLSIIMGLMGSLLIINIIV